MATDIVEQCREHAAAFGAGGIASSLSEIFRGAADEIERLKNLLDGRDQFIVNNGLWHEFVANLEK